MSDKRTEQRRLPVGIAEFDELVTALRAEYGDEMPTSNDEDVKFAVSTTIMHMGPRDSHITLDFFYKTLVAAASKQVAHHVFQETKLKQQERAEAEKAASDKSKDEQSLQE